MSRNIQFKESNFTLVDGYFYMMDQATNILYQRTADSSTSFSFPLDSLLSHAVTSLEYDGQNLWTLEKSSGTSLIIKRWVLDNYVCKQQQEITLNPEFGHTYNADTFTVEHYHTTTSGVIGAGSTNVYVEDYWTKVTSGMTITLGPNYDGYKETLNVQGYQNGVIILSDPTEHEYLVNTAVSFYTNIWLFNNYDGDDSTSAALYKLNAYTGSYLTRYSGDEYKNITACTFYKITSFHAYGPVDTLCYVKGTNILFVNTTDTGTSLSYYGSMVIDNVDENDVDVLQVFDLAIEGDNIYKLQLQANYFGNTEEYDLYNYHVATQTSMVTSVSLLVDPSIIAANGVSAANVVARVKDQFLQPIAGRMVYFASDDSSGGDIVGGNPVNTDSNGEAGTIYRAGTEAREVKLTATVDQV
jgi:hypothetical protein